MTTSPTAQHPREAALAADLKRFQSTFPDLIRARVAAHQAAVDARAALAAAEQAERLATSAEDVAAAEMDRTIARHGAAAGQPGMTPLNCFANGLRFRIATGDGDPKLAPMLKRVEALMMRMIQQPVEITVADLRNELEA